MNNSTASEGNTSVETISSAAAAAAAEGNNNVDETVPPTATGSPVVDVVSAAATAVDVDNGEAVALPTATGSPVVDVVSAAAAAAAIGVTYNSPTIPPSEVADADADASAAVGISDNSSVDIAASAAAAAVGVVSTSQDNAVSSAQVEPLKAVGTDTTSSSTDAANEVTSDVTASGVSDTTNPVSHIDASEQVNPIASVPSKEINNTSEVSTDANNTSVVTSPVIDDNQGIDDNIEKLRELLNQQQIDDFACYELINKIAEGEKFTIGEKCQSIDSLLKEEEQTGGVQTISQQINTDNELEGYLKKDKIVNRTEFLSHYNTFYKNENANKPEYKNKSFYDLEPSKQAKVYRNILDFYTKYNKQKTIENSETDTQRRIEQGAYAIYVKIKLILVEGDVDLDDAECKDRFNNIKTGFANIINKLPLENTPFGKYIPDTTIKPKTVRSDTAKLSNNKTVKNKPEEKPLREPNNYAL